MTQIQKQGYICDLSHKSEFFWAHHSIPVFHWLQQSGGPHKLDPTQLLSEGINFHWALVDLFPIEFQAKIETKLQSYYSDKKKKIFIHLYSTWNDYATEVHL